MRVKAGEDKTTRCPACGSQSHREAAKYCLVCGKLMSEDYQPLDAIRSSYRLQRKGLATETVRIVNPERLFAEERNSVADTAWACTVYSMVPYLGILFVPLGVAIGCYGYYGALQRPDMEDGRNLAATSVGLSLFILAVQIFLWWLLYIIPEIGIGD